MLPFLYSETFFLACLGDPEFGFSVKKMGIDLITAVMDTSICAIEIPILLFYSTKRLAMNRVESFARHPEILSSYEAYGCKFNTISPEELFHRYGEAGFLYPAKMGKLAPYLPLVKENWRKAMRGGDPVLYTVTHQEADSFSSIAAWRSTWTGTLTQHLVSQNSPIGSRAVMLSEQAAKIRDPICASSQNWFRPENRYPARVFGTINKSVSEEHSVVSTFNLFFCPLSCGKITGNVAIVADVRNGRQSGLYELAEKARGRVYAEAEELSDDDLLLDSVDQLYIKVDLRRYRRVWLAMLPGHNQPVGAVVAYRGPLGLNFSFLENRCDLLLSPVLTHEQVAEVTQSLLAVAANAYDDFQPGMIPLIADDRAAIVLQDIGTQFVRKYCQSIWLRDGFIDWYRHVEKFYDRIMLANKRSGLGEKKKFNLSNTKSLMESDHK